MTETPGNLIEHPTMTDLEAAPDRSLAEALERLRVDGAIFFRSEFTESWAYESLSDEVAPLLRPGAERLMIFHIVARGTCWVSVGDGERHWAEEGDVIVIPYGDLHRLGGVGPAECVSIGTLLDPMPWSRMPVLQHGGGGNRTDIICGYLYSEDPLFDPRNRAFPPAFVVRPPAGPVADWVRSSIDYALALSSGGPPQVLADTRLPELLLIEVLRLHLSSAPAADRGWVAAFRDPVLAPALARLHAAPSRKWTVSDLAAEVPVSRSLLDERFREVLGTPPMRYLTEWRLHVAKDRLSGTDQSIERVARSVGYESVEAFSRAFKRAFGQSPRAWRSGPRRAG